MPAASSRRSTPVRKKSKLDHHTVPADSTNNGHEEASEDVFSPAPTPTRTRARRAANPASETDLTESIEETSACETTVQSSSQASHTITQNNASRQPRGAKIRAKAKLDQVALALSVDPEATKAVPAPHIVPEFGGDNTDALASTEASESTSTPSRARGRRKAPAPKAGDSSSAKKAIAPASEPDTPEMPAAETTASTPARTKRNPRGTGGKAKKRLEDDDFIEPISSASDSDISAPPPEPASLSTPAKNTPRTPRRPKGKAKAKPDDDDFDDDEEETVYGKNPDVEIFSIEGPLSTINRIQLKTNKSRSLRPQWLQGVYQPPFFGIPTADVVGSVANSDRDSQPDEIRDTESVEGALPWPRDGFSKTWHDPNVYPTIKKSLLKFWFGHVGWIPNQAIYDMGWFPGKAIGWKQNRQRSEWAKSARQQIGQHANLDDVFAQGDRPGWPFVQPWIDVLQESLVILSKEQAAPFLQDTTTPQRSQLCHPITTMKLTVPELTMRSRLRKSNVGDTLKSAKKASRPNADIGGAQVDEAEEEEDAAYEDENEIAALDADQEPINLDDPKFANIPNLGFQEKGPVYGDVLQISVGPPDRETPVEIPKGTSRRLDSLGLEPEDGHLLNVGGHVYALDWVPVPVHLNTGKEYFAVSAAASKAPLTFIGQKQQNPAPASLQIWSVSPNSPASKKQAKGEARLEMVVCHNAGAAFKLAWCPVGHDFGDIADKNGKQGRLCRLGLLAGCFADGSISVFSVPHPMQVREKNQVSTDEPIHIRLDPILKLEHPQQAATCLAWAGGEMLALGASQGWIGVWNIGRILRQTSNAASPPPPDYVVRAHRSSIMDLTFILLPPLDSEGVVRTSSVPTTLFTVSLDGWIALVDLVRSSSTSIERSRAVHYACTFSPFSGGSLVHEHADGSVAHYSMRPEEMLRARQISLTPSRVLSLSCSTCHPMVAMASAHGEVKLANILRTLRRSQRNHLAIYQTIIDRSTGQLVMRHHLQPEIASIAENRAYHIAQWHPCLAATAVKWNPNLARCRLLLSGTAAGVVKVDFVKPPYESS